MFEDLIKDVVHNNNCPYHVTGDYYSPSMTTCNGYKKWNIPDFSILCVHLVGQNCALRQSKIAIGCDRWSICTVWPIECDRCIQ